MSILDNVFAIDFAKPSPLTTAIRDALKGLGGLLVGTGLATESQVALWTGAILFLANSAYAIWKQYKMASTT